MAETKKKLISFQNDGSYLFSLVLQFLSMELCQRTFELSAFRPDHLSEVVRSSFADAKVRRLLKPHNI